MPRFSITSDPFSSSIRRNNFPKLARARRADTTIAPLLPALEGVAMNSPFQLSELYSSFQAKSRERQGCRAATTARPRVVSNWESNFRGARRRNGNGGKAQKLKSSEVESSSE